MIVDLICDEAGTTPEFEFIAETGENQYVRICNVCMYVHMYIAISLLSLYS